MNGPKDHDYEGAKEKFGEIYLGEKKTICTDIFFILANKMTNFQIDAS